MSVLPSLLTLSQIIQSLSMPPSKRPKHINYRDSKLTRILQPHLSGNALLAMLCCVSPAKTSLEETRYTLRFAARAKLVKTTANVNETVNREELISNLRKELQETKKALVNMQQESEETRRASLEAAEEVQQLRDAVTQETDLASRSTRSEEMEWAQPISIDSSKHDLVHQLALSDDSHDAIPIFTPGSSFDMTPPAKTPPGSSHSAGNNLSQVQRKLLDSPPSAPQPQPQMLEPQHLDLDDDKKDENDDDDDDEEEEKEPEDAMEDMMDDEPSPELQRRYRKIVSPLQQESAPPLPMLPSRSLDATAEMNHYSPFTPQRPKRDEEGMGVSPSMLPRLDMSPIDASQSAITKGSDAESINELFRAAQNDVLASVEAPNGAVEGHKFQRVTNKANRSQPYGVTVESIRQELSLPTEVVVMKGSNGDKSSSLLSPPRQKHNGMTQKQSMTTSNEHLMIAFLENKLESTEDLVENLLKYLESARKCVHELIFRNVHLGKKVEKLVRKLDRANRKRSLIDNMNPNQNRTVPSDASASDTTVMTPSSTNMVRVATKAAAGTTSIVRTLLGPADADTKSKYRSLRIAMYMALFFFCFQMKEMFLATVIFIWLSVEAYA